MMLAVGDLAPDFVAQAHTGQAVRLHDYRDKVVLLWFYPRAATPG
jgi:peroxiredoxin Q/BCP